MTIWLEDGLKNQDQSVETAFGKLVTPSESHSDNVPSIAIVRSWFSSVRYSGEIGAKGTLKKSCLPPRWRLLMAQIIQCQWGKTGRLDQISNKDAIILYCLTNGVEIDFARNDKLTLNPTQVFSVHNWVLKPNQPEGPPFTDHMLAICKAKEPMEFKAPRISSRAEKRGSQGKMFGAKTGLRRKQSSKHTFESKTKANKGGSSTSPTGFKTGHSDQETQSSSVVDTNPSKPSASTPVVAELHKEGQQAADGLTSLGATSEEGAYPRLSSDIRADLGISTPNDSIPQQQGMDEGTQNYSLEHIFVGTNPSVLVDKTKSAGDGLKIAHTHSGINVESSFDEISKTIKLEDLLKLMQDDENEEEEEADKYEDTHATSHEETKYSSVPHPPSPKTDQLKELTNQLLVKSIKPKLSKLVSFYDFSNFIPSELKELPSKITVLSGEVKELKKYVQGMEFELPGDLKEIPNKRRHSLPQSIVLPPSLLNKATDTFNMFVHIMENALPKNRDKGVPLAGQVGASLAEGEKNTNQVTIFQLFQRKIAKNSKKANLKQQPTTTTPPTTSSFQYPFFPSPPRSTPQTKGELIKKYKGKKAMSSKDAEEEETKSDTYNDYANPADSMVESSKKKKLKKFDFVTEGGEQFHFLAKKIKEQKRIEESLKADLAKQEVEEAKNELVDLMGIDVVTKFYKNKLLCDKYCDKMLKRRKSSKITNCDVLTRSGPITLKVYREDGTTKVIPNFKTSDLHLAEWREVVQACPNRKGKGWKTIYEQIKARMDYLHHTEEELKIDFNKPLVEQDPMDELNDLSNKKRKKADDFHDYFRSMV
ncbi:hypothetical protein Tco_0059171 [Tanacetum coccineum]